MFSRSAQGRPAISQTPTKPPKATSQELCVKSSALGFVGPRPFGPGLPNIPPGTVVQSGSREEPAVETNPAGQEGYPNRKPLDLP